MTDSYPPFRMDSGGADPAHPSSDIGTRLVASDQESPPRSRWSAGGIVAVIVGSLLVLGGLGSAAGGAALLIGNTVARGTDGLIRTLDGDL
jgi:hypothetical protein